MPPPSHYPHSLFAHGPGHAIPPPLAGNRSAAAAGGAIHEQALSSALNTLLEQRQGGGGSGSHATPGHSASFTALTPREAAAGAGRALGDHPHARPQQQAAAGSSGWDEGPGGGGGVTFNLGSSTPATTPLFPLPPHFAHHTHLYDHLQTPGTAQQPSYNTSQPGMHHWGGAGTGTGAGDAWSQPVDLRALIMLAVAAAGGTTAAGALPPPPLELTAYASAPLVLGGDEPTPAEAATLGRGGGGPLRPVHLRLLVSRCVDGGWLLALRPAVVLRNHLPLHIDASLMLLLQGVWVSVCVRDVCVCVCVEGRGCMCVRCVGVGVRT